MPRPRRKLGGEQGSEPFVQRGRRRAEGDRRRLAPIGADPAQPAAPGGGPYAAGRDPGRAFVRAQRRTAEAALQGPRLGRGGAAARARCCVVRWHGIQRARAGREACRAEPADDAAPGRDDGRRPLGSSSRKRHGADGGGFCVPRGGIRRRGRPARDSFRHAGAGRRRRRDRAPGACDAGRAMGRAIDRRGA